MTHIQDIRAELGALDALLLTDPISIRYACGFFITDGAAVVSREGAWLVTDSRYEEAARAAVRDMEVRCVSGEVPLSDHLKELTGGLASVGAEKERMSHGEWLATEERLALTLTPADGILAGLRAVKDEAEVELLTKAQRIAERALDEVLGILRPGLTEKQVAAELVYRMYKYGGEANSFDPIVVAGRKTSMPHGVPGDEVIESGGLVTMDFGTMYGGYCSDMTRTVAVGKPTQQMRDVYDIVLEAQLAGIDAARAGATGREIDGAARRVIEKAGYGEYFGHGFGHSLGLEIHEAPNANAKNDKPMPDGAFTSAEPGIYLPGRFGVRIEDTMWIRADGARVVTKAPKSELIVL